MASSHQRRGRRAGSGLLAACIGLVVGRAAERATVERVLAAARCGRGGVLLITGEAGIGKSRMLEEAARLAVDSGMTVLTGRAVEGGGTYRPIAEALLAHLRDTDVIE